MGASLSCPAGFEPGAFLSCRVQCPQDFKYTMSGTAPNSGGQCVYLQDNSVTVDLMSLPMVSAGQPIPDGYGQEQARFTTALIAARAKAATNADTKSQVALLNTQRSVQAADYSRIQTEYAGYSSAMGTRDVIREVSNSIKPFRPPTAPAEDINKERKAILETAKKDMMFIQIALFIVVLVLVNYIVLPASIAHMIAFLLVVVGIAFGFFLRK